MKYKVLALCLGISLSAFAGNESGNGGYKLILNNGNHILLDRWDAQRIHGYTIDLGRGNSVNDKIQKMIDRWSRVNQQEAQRIGEMALNIEKHSIEIDNEYLLCNNDAIIGEHILHTLDIGKSIIPRDAKLIPVARNLKRSSASCRIDPTISIYFYKNNMRGLSQDDIAMLRLHEVIYSLSYDTDSYNTRALVGLLASQQADQMSDWELMNEMINKLKVANLEINGFVYPAVMSLTKDEGQSSLRISTAHHRWRLNNYCFQKSEKNKNISVFNHQFQAFTAALDCQVILNTQSEPLSFAIYPLANADEVLTYESPYVKMAFKVRAPLFVHRYNAQNIYRLVDASPIDFYQPVEDKDTIIESLVTANLELHKAKLENLSFYPDGKLQCVEVYFYEKDSYAMFQGIKYLKASATFTSLPHFNLCFTEEGKVKEFKAEGNVEFLFLNKRGSGSVRADSPYAIAVSSTDLRVKKVIGSKNKNKEEEIKYLFLDTTGKPYCAGIKNSVKDKNGRLGYEIWMDTDFNAIEMKHCR